jgi:hypothetical protein
MDWSTVLKYGTDKSMLGEVVKVGLVGGFLYKCMNWYVDSCVNRDGLPPGVVSVYDDVELTSLFTELQKHRDVSEYSFRKAIDNADRLVYRYINLRDKVVTPEIRDRVDSYAFFRASVSGAYSMFNSTKMAQTSKQSAVVHRLYEKIYYKLQKYFREIMTLTVNV